MVVTDETPAEDAATEEIPAEDAAEAPVDAAVVVTDETPAEAKTASAKGFQSDVTVTVTLNEDGTIATLAVDAAGETIGYGQNCQKDAFTAQFIGKALPVALTTAEVPGIDAVAGATLTSQAVVDALNSLVAAE